MSCYAASDLLTWRSVSHTCLWLHREVGLPLQNGVDELGVVAKRGVISICGRHLEHGGACQETCGGASQLAGGGWQAVPLDEGIKELG